MGSDNDEILKQILAGQERIEERLTDMQKEVARLSERTTSLESWRTATDTNTSRFWNHTWEQAQRLQAVQEDRLRTIEREHTTLDEFKALEERVRENEKFKEKVNVYIVAIGSISAVVVSIVVKLLHLS